MVYLDNSHWTSATHKQRMLASEWKELLLGGFDRMIFYGNCVKLTAKNLGCGVVEVSKQFPDEKKTSLAAKIKSLQKENERLRKENAQLKNTAVLEKHQ